MNIYVEVPIKYTSLSYYYGILMVILSSIIMPSYTLAAEKLLSIPYNELMHLHLLLIL